MTSNIVEMLNTLGRSFVDFAWPMLIQSCVLIAMMLGVDLVIRKRVRAVVRYWLWMLVMVKLVLPTSLTLPMSVGYWVGLDRSAVSIPMQEMPRTMSPLAQSTPTPEISIDRPTSIEPPVISAITQELKTPPTVQIHQPPPAIDWRALIFLGWLAIAAAMALLVIQRYGFVKGLIRQSRDAEGKTAAIFDECVTQMNLLKKPILKISPSMVSPAACGLLHPVVILPELMITNLNEKEMRAVLLHELTHIGRGDLWINCIQTFLQVVYFYNPLLWPANSVIRRLREQAVDETVLVTLREEAEDYPRTLVNVAKLAMARPALSLRLVGVVESKSALADRIKHMLSRPFPKSSKLGGLALTGIFILAALLLPMAKGEKKVVHEIQPATEPMQATEGKPLAGVMENEKTFKATFSNGVTAELAGVSYHPSKGKEWWRADGSKLVEPLYDNMSGHVSLDEKSKTREIVLKRSELTPTKDAMYVWEIPDSRASGGDAFDKTGKSIKGLKGIAVVIPKN